MRYRRLATASLAVLAAGRPAAAMNPARALTQAQHRIWQVPQGLPEASVYAIHQTRDGYLWLGTQSGLVRFDGLRFVTIPDADAGDWVRGIAEDRGGTLWVATDTGVRRLCGDTVTTFTTADGLPADRAAAVAVDDTGTVWAATARGLARFTGGRWTAAGPAADVRAMAVIGDAVWSAEGSLAHGAGGATLDAGGTVSCLCAGPDGATWAGTNHGLVRWDRAGRRRFTAADGLADDAVTSLSAGSNGTLWVGTRNGFSRYRGGRFESFRAADGLSQSTVFAVTEDREGTLWVGTKHGLNQLLDRRAVPFTQTEGLPSNDAGPVVGDAAGAVWVGTRDAGLCRFDGTTFAPPLTAATGLPGNRVNALALDGPSGLWVGTDRGAARLADGHVVAALTTADGLPSSVVTCLCDDRSGLWIGTTAGATVWRGGHAKPVHDGPVRAVGRWGDRMVLATADAGLLAVAADGTTTAIAPLATADALYADAAGLLWVGTDGDGLRLVDRAGHVTAFTPAEGLFDDDVYGIVPDDAGRLWMACSKGVFWAARADLLAVAGGRARQVRCTPFSPTDSLRTVECQPGVQPAACRARDGRLWFATIHGVLVFDPADFAAGGPAARQPLAAALEDVTVDGRPARPDAVAHLPPGERNLTFRYTAMTLVAPAAARFRYQLVGFDPAPIDAGTRREAYYTNLPPGRYQFRVTAALPDGPAGLPATIEVGLAPRLYQRAWFWPAVAGVAASLGWAGYRSRVRQVRDRLRQRHAATSAERARIARELHDTLLQGFSGVTMQMQALSVRLPDPDNRAMLADIIGDAGRCMAEARRSVAGLRDASAVALPAALAATARQLTEPSDVRLLLQLDDPPEGTSPEAEYHLLRIAQEAVGNTVRHAAATRVTVTLHDGDGRLRMTVADDGRGFDPAAPPPPGHFGLIGMRERAARIGATLQVESHPGRGTAVQVSLPAGQPVAD
jgi:signal transduction histidine kinase/ligand-binding sensor domain-containing protein